MHRTFLVFIAISICLCFSCNSVSKNTQNNDMAIHKVIAEPVAPGSFNAASGISFDGNAIQKFLVSKPLFKEFSKEFDTFYRAKNYNYLWYDKNGLIETSSQLISGIDNVEQEA